MFVADMAHSALVLPQSDLGAAIAYEGLVDIFLQRVVPYHFGVPLSDQLKARMQEVAKYYSKVGLRPSPTECCLCFYQRRVWADCLPGGA
jgi:hypothetical protein